jgi:hypothetical protein
MSVKKHAHLQTQNCCILDEAGSVGTNELLKTSNRV